MTESGVQKIFSGDDCSIIRLNEICTALNVSLAELLKVSNEMHTTHRIFTPEQESFFIEDMDCFYFFWELKQARYEFSKVQQRHSLSDASVQKYLLKLDKLGLIELHPDNQIKTVYDSKDGEHWSNESSKLRKVFRNEIQRRYFEFLLSKDGCALTSNPLAIINMKRDTVRDLKIALHNVQIEFLNRAHRENPFANADDLITVGNLNAITPFTYSDVIRVPNI